MFLCVSCTELHTSVQPPCPARTAGRLTPQASLPDQTVPVQTSHHRPTPPHPCLPNTPLAPYYTPRAPPRSPAHPGQAQRQEASCEVTRFRRKSEAEEALACTGVKLWQVGKNDFHGYKRGKTKSAHVGYC